MSTMPAPPDSPGAAPGGTGFCGKLPSHGDFLSRRVPAAVLGKWEAWLDAGLARSREILGEAWLETYLSSPIWRFALAAGLCGDTALVGVMMPSMDRVGRYYPLTIIATLEPGRSAAEVAFAATAWFDRIEALALSCLGDSFDFASFDGALALEALPPPLLAGDAVEMPCAEEGPAAALAPLLGLLMERRSLPYALWWSSGSKGIAPCCRIGEGLPSADEFSRFLG